MSWRWEIAERDHDIQNPTSREKIRLLGEYLRLERDSRVLDVACGKGGPALVLARTYGCRVVGIEKLPAFADEARRRVAAEGLDSLVEIRTADASDLRLAAAEWDAALCLGASFVWGTIADAGTALAPAVRRGGGVAVGEPFWRQWPPPNGIEPDDFVALDATVSRFEDAGLDLTGIIAASEDDWDRYESLHWRALEEWLGEHPGHDDADAMRERHVAFRSEYLRRRELLGWAIFVGRRR